MPENIKLSSADMKAISLNDSFFINNKGANYYVNDDFEKAVEYYRIASAMGDVHATSNLGYCYLYGRSIEQNLSLALAYFNIASRKNDIDATYKLGDIYSSDKWGIQDKELSVYYYRLAADLIIGNNPDKIVWITELRNYPSLCFALGREMSLNGSMATDIESAYQFLKHAEKGYRNELNNGRKMYEQAYESLLEWLADPQFDPVRELYDEYYNEDDENDDDDDLTLYN